MIMMISDIFKALGIGYTLKLNSLGDQNCMPQYRDSLVSYIESVEDEICEDCKRRKSTNPIRVLDCKNEKCQSLLNNSPKLIDNLCNNCDSDFQKLVKLLKSENIDYEIDTHLVRGLDYYSKTAFEFVSNDIGSQSAIAGGGRYDKLVEFLDGKPTPAVGFALGIERIMELVKMPEISREGYYIGAMEKEAIDSLFALASKKRATDKVTLEYAPKKLKAHLKGADRVNARYCAVVGEDEFKEKQVWVKDLVEKEEKLITWSDF
jgi:histidyl-tRNA synthetase